MNAVPTCEYACITRYFENYNLLVCMKTKKYQFILPQMRIKECRAAAELIMPHHQILGQEAC